MKPLILGLLGVALLASSGAAQGRGGPLDTEHLPAYLRDRGAGMPLSQFATYIERGQLIIYPFYEYYKDKDYEYSPNELGKPLDQDFRGEYEAHEGLLFIAYGFTDWLAVELEGAIIKAELLTSSEDPSGLPPRIEESGLGDVEGQIRWRWNRETASRPEVFSYFETVGPTQDEGSLIGTTDWEFKLGAGLIRGYTFGTMAARAAVEYDLAEESFGLGEVALEYVKRLSPHWRVYGGFEGTQDEVAFIVDVQWHFSRYGLLKAGNGFGLTSKATDWAPEVGLMFNFYPGR